MYNQTVSNAIPRGHVIFNASHQAYIPGSIHPVVLDNNAGIVIKFSEKWSNIEYHEGRIIVYRNDQGKISVLEVEYDESSTSDV
ncbi:hypothetical protein [Metallosphaera hakonensis]|uniref:Uncharacterized protein n=1 Tax=Metallosphaera hakonensis JCM 8857 = DSM 7519 TaxID=1293036 RepID=A0A2U9IQW8_9CREN|nr:hypothetical protein [Metallosphaera hakonensis]AWR98374.1 hypothetical protein DFR87_00105 [Metallosphaera hakonensis JCM 8857 = DSM 7519]